MENQLTSTHFKAILAYIYLIQKVFMKAVYFDKLGGTDVLKYGELSTPKPKKGEALIRVKACALNYLDIWLRKDETRNIPLPHVPGSDVSGIIEEINGESELKVGDEIVVNPAIPCGSCPRCVQQQPCELVKIFGAKTWGGYAEYVVVPIQQLYRKPKNLNWAEAAAFPLTFLTAWHMLVSKAKLQKGETVFIWGASGGLGMAAIEIAKYFGAKVIAAARTDKTAEKIKQIRADEVVVYTKENVEERMKKLTEHGVDVVFESVGEKTWNTSLNILRFGGRLVIAGATSGEMGTQSLSDLYYKQLSIFGCRMGNREEFEQVLKVVEQGKIKPRIDKVFPLKDGTKAQQRMEEGKHLGKIVLEVK